MKKYFLLFSLITVLGGIVWTTPQPVFAQGIFNLGGGTAKGLGSNGKETTLSECIQDGSCGVEHLLLLANSLMTWMVMVSGAVALLMYVMGGVWMIMSAGNSTRVERGKSILIGTTVALVVILGAWLMVSFILEALNTKSQYRLQTTKCANVSCPGGQTCQNKTGTCVNLCVVEHAADPRWSCQDFALTGATPCEDGKCAGAANIKCCFK